VSGKNKYPSVTESLGPWADFSMVRPEVLEAACIRGSEIHHICASIIQGLWTPEPPEYRGYLQSFRKWFDLVETVHFIEQEFIDDDFGFIAHPDLIVTMRGDDLPVVRDLKTPVAKYKSWRLQLSAYGRVAEKAMGKIKDVGSLRLDPNGGTPKCDISKDWRQDFGLFLGNLNTWNFFNG